MQLQPCDSSAVRLKAATPVPCMLTPFTPDPAGTQLLWSREVCDGALRSGCNWLHPRSRVRLLRLPHPPLTVHRPALFLCGAETGTPRPPWWQRVILHHQPRWQLSPRVVNRLVRTLQAAAGRRPAVALLIVLERQQRHVLLLPFGPSSRLCLRLGPARSMFA